MAGRITLIQRELLEQVDKNGFYPLQKAKMNYAQKTIKTLVVAGLIQIATINHTTALVRTGK